MEIEQEVQTPSGKLQTALEFDWTLSADVSETINGIDFALSASHTQSGRQQTPSEGMAIEKVTNIAFDVSFTLDPVDINWSASNVFTGGAEPSNTFTTSLDLSTTFETMFGDLDVSASTQLTNTSSPDNPQEDTQEFSSSLEISIPLNDLVSLEVTLLDHSRTSFPNDPDKDDQVSNAYSVGLSVDFEPEELPFLSGSASISLDRTETPEEPAQVSLNMSSDITFTLGEDVEIGLSPSISASGATSNLSLTFSIDASF